MWVRIKSHERHFTGLANRWEYFHIHLLNDWRISVWEKTRVQLCYQTIMLSRQKKISLFTRQAIPPIKILPWKGMVGSSENFSRIMRNFSTWKFEVDILVRVISEIFPSNRKLTFRHSQVEINFPVTDTDKLSRCLLKNYINKNRMTHTVHSFYYG